MIIDDIKKYLDSFGGSFEEKEGLYIFNYTAGERKTSLNQKKVSYTAKLRIMEDKKLVRFSEIVKENSSGLGVGDDLAPGFGYKKESFKVGGSGREGSLKEKSQLGGQKLDYVLSYQEIRNKIKELSEKQGYTFKYKIFPWGL